MTSNQTNTDRHFNIALQGFYTDAIGLSAIYKSGQLHDILDFFKDYETYLNSRQKNINSTKLIKKISKGTGIINSNIPNNDLKEVLYIAHAAACCATFNDWAIPFTSLEQQALRDTITRSLTPPSGLSKQEIIFLGNRLGQADTIRSIQILRLLGLFKTKSSNIRQISFAAGAGYRDMYGFHPIPVITSKSNAFSMAENRTLCFDLKQIDPEALVLIDNNPLLKERYEDLSNNNPGHILALVDDADKAIEKMPEILTKKSWKPFNCISGIRIDHRMIPDAKKFITSLTPILDDTADLIISIGSGDVLDDFIGRKKVMQNIFDFLTDRKLSPVKITMHGGTSREEQFESPCFSVSNFTTYELLYCKLKRNNL